MADLRKLAEAREALARILAPFAGHRLTYDDGITDDTTNPPEQGKPAALYLDGDWVADFDTTMLPKEKRDDIGRAIVAVLKHAPVVLAQVDRLHDLVRHQRGPLHDAGLLTDEEYAALAADHGAVGRLETIDGLRASLATVTRERDEARAALLNERGEGTGPSEGWARNDFDRRAVGIAWYRPSNADGSPPPAGAMDYVYVLWVYREPTEPEWTWECEHADFSSRNIQGKAPTAREAMRAADTALAGAKS